LSPPRSLFRQEAIDAQREKLLGEVSRARPVPAWVFTVLAGSFAVALVAFAFLGSYTRRERVEGVLDTDQPPATVSVPEAAVITELLVKEGDEVVKGQPLARLSQERTMGSGANASVLVRQQLQARLDSLDKEAGEVRELGEEQLAQAHKRVDDLGKELAESSDAVRAQQARLDSAQLELARFEQLGAEKFAPEPMVRQKKNDVIDQTGKLAEVKANRTRLERDLRAARAEPAQIQLRMQAQLQQIEQRQSELRQNLVQEATRGDTEVRAAIDGTVTNITAARGASLPAGTALAVILPKGSRLIAELLVPTRAIGFITPGNGVVLRYEAFPFQRFGQYHGQVRNIGLTVFSAGTRVGSMVAREPVYRIEVGLDAQSIKSGGQEIALRPGMLLGADILLEKRTVFEWVFEPVLALRERLR
jgi:membrane fusion protein